MADIKKTQHFSENWETILFNINLQPTSACDPFAGACNLVEYAPDADWELYDIDIKDSRVIYRDTLLNPPDYSGKTVITNPPYLAKNRTKEFDKIFEKYQTDNLYKASILSIMGCENGILIIPLNFFTDENTKDIRKKFLSQYKVSYVNVFTQPVFKHTTYNVCSFYFEKGKTDTVTFYDYFASKRYIIKLCEEFGYRVGGSFYNSFEKEKPIFSRTLENKANTNIFVNCLDTKAEKFHLEYRPGFVYKGKKTDKIFATLNCEENLSEEQQKKLCEEFNSRINKQRAVYGNLLFSNFRDAGRKRISFKDVYKICTKLLRFIQS